MKKEQLEQALNEISDRRIVEAATAKRKFPWIGAVAAVLAIAILLASLWQPQTPPDITLQDPTATNPTHAGTVPHGTLATDPLSHRYALATANYPVLCAYPKENSGDFSAWWNDQRSLHNQPLGYADNLKNYFDQIVPALLAENQGRNAACSPVNIYMALAMLAEITDGQSRQQILKLMNADSIEALRTQAKHVWRAHYNNDGLSTSVLGSSLWLEEGYNYSEDTVSLLAENYYASVFRGDLGTDEMNTALQSWLNEQTQGLLQEQAQNVELSPETLLALATTICYQVQWQDEFYEQLNTQAIFHGAAGDTAATFMNKEMMFGPYYWSEDFSAVYLPLEDGSRMWLILPDEDTSPEALLKSGEISDFFAQNPSYYDTDYENKKSIRVNLSLPKFDISSQLEISDALKSLGIFDVFDKKAADFSPIIPQEDGGYVNRISHAARVKIDEEGVTAAAFTVIDYAGSAAPPEDEIDFVLDRPFLFIVESSDALPLFAGIVNEI